MNLSHTLSTKRSNVQGFLAPPVVARSHTTLLVETGLALLPALTVAAEPETPSSCCAGTGRAALMLASQSGSSTPQPPATPVAPAGMVWIPGGEFTMGSTDPLARPDESPVQRARVDGFWMDTTEVTNAQFAEFAKATGYKTVAERPVD